MPERSQQWYDRVRRRLDADGPRPVPWTQWPSWPFVGEVTPRDLRPPVEEQERGGAGGLDCFMCAADDAVDVSYLCWRDEHLMIGQPQEDTSLPFAAFLMPRRHADLHSLSPEVATRMGLVLVGVERAVTEVLDVPRLHVHRFGDGQEHLHWWLLGRPSGVDQLRGVFLPLWDDLLPARPREDLRADLDLVATRLVELVGGEVLRR